MRLKSLRTIGDAGRNTGSQARHAASSCSELIVVLLASADLELTPSLNDLKWTDPSRMMFVLAISERRVSYLRVHNREIATRSTEQTVPVLATRDRREGPCAGSRAGEPSMVPGAFFSFEGLLISLWFYFTISAYLAWENRRAEHQRRPGDEEHGDDPHRAS